MEAELRTIEGKPVLRFERTLNHSPEKVWQVVTTPSEMKHWFPAEVEIDGKQMRFTFPDEAPVDELTNGEILEHDPPKVFAFRWVEDVLRFEILPTETGCRLILTTVVTNKLSVGRDAPGWETCLDALIARTDGTTYEPPATMLPRMEHYIAKFGLDEGEETGTGVRFERDLVWKPLDDVWKFLTEDANPTTGSTPPLPATAPHLTPGKVTRAEAPHLLEYEWLDDDQPAGVVRWEFNHEPLQGTTVTVTQQNAQGPAALASWHVHMELFFAATQGEIRCPWPQDREEELRKHYEATRTDQPRSR